MINIVLFEPEIPQNTGNIMRTCVALGARLHLIEPLGFRLDEKRLKRSALDYFAHLDYTVYEDYDDFESKNPGTYVFLTRYGKKAYTMMDYQHVDGELFLLFGKESTGIDKSILARHLDQCYRIPTTDKVRSINLSNAVALVAYEAARQQGFQGLFSEEPEIYKGRDFLDQFIEED